MLVDRCKHEKVEVVLRMLRTSRVRLLYDYSQEIMGNVFMDAIKMELLNEVNVLRKRAYLLPRDSMVHKIIEAKHGEHEFAYYKEEKKEHDKMSTPHLNHWFDQREKKI